MIQNRPSGKKLLFLYINVYFNYLEISYWGGPKSSFFEILLGGKDFMDLSGFTVLGS